MFYSILFYLGKGHAAPILYAAWAEAGLFPVEELLNLRKIDSDLEGHPTPRLSFVDVATGSLGQGLSVAAGLCHITESYLLLKLLKLFFFKGMAYVGKYIDKADYRVYCLIGDGEAAEGSIWEALSFASHYKLDNLCAIIDVNRLGQSEPTAFGHEIGVYDKRCQAFGWQTYPLDGHNVKALADAFEQAAKVSGKPQMVIAQTFKGRGILIKKCYFDYL